MLRLFQWMIFGHVHEWTPYGDPLRRAPSLSGTIGAIVHPVKCAKCGKISQFEIE